MTMHPRVGVSGISTWNWPLDRDLAFYDDAAIHTIGLSLRKLDPRRWRDDVDRVVARGIQVADVIGLGPFHLDAPDQWPDQRDRLRWAIDVAVAAAAPCLVATTGPAGALGWEEAADALEAALTPILPIAADAGVTVALEHTNSLRVDVGFVHTLRDMVDLATRLGTAVCLEVNACWAERDLASTIVAARDRVALVQVSDFAIGTRSTPDRLVPGDGDIPLHRILHQILDAGYGGVFELELIGPRVEDEGYEKAVPRAITALGELLRDLGV